MIKHFTLSLIPVFSSYCLILEYSNCWFIDIVRLVFCLDFSRPRLGRWGASSWCLSASLNTVRIFEFYAFIVCLISIFKQSSIWILIYEWTGWRKGVHTENYHIRICGSSHRIFFSRVLSDLLGHEMNLMYWISWLCIKPNSTHTISFLYFLFDFLFGSCLFGYGILLDLTDLVLLSFTGCEPLKVQYA